MEASPKFQLINKAVAVKVSLNDDIRRFTLDGGYSALCQEIASMFQLSPDASFALKYNDNEDDLVTLCNDRDLAEAKRVCGSTLKLKVLPSAVPVAKPAIAVTTTTETVKEAVPLDKESKEAKAARKEQKRKEKEQRKALEKEAKAAKKGSEAASVDPKETDQKKPAKEKDPKPLKEGKQEKELSKEERQKAKEQKRGLKEAAKELKRSEKEHKRGCKKSADDSGKPPKDKLEARFVKDITLEDGTEVQPGSSIVKTWRFRNEGTKTWPSGSKLIFVSKMKGDIMGAPEEVVAPVAEPGAEVDISVPMVAPTAPGRYVGFWRLCTPEGNKFGQRVRVLVYVPAASSSSDSSSAAEEDPIKKNKHAGKKEHKHCKHAGSVEVTPELLEKAAQLEKLGFTNQKWNLRLLHKFDGDLSAVVHKLVLRQHKEKKLRESPKKKNDDM